MKTKSKALLISFSALAAVLLALFAVRAVFIGDKYRSSLEYSYARAIGDLTDGLDKMQTAFEKSEYCSTPTMQHRVSTAIISYGGKSKANIGILPFSSDNSAKIEKLVSVAEDYAYYTGRKLAAGQVFSEEDHANYKAIGEYIGKLNESLKNIRSRLDENNLTIGKTERLLESTLEIPDAPSFDDSLKSFNEELDAFPKLLYDGPFSSHIEQQTSVYLEGKALITKEQAVERAAAFLGADAAALKCENETDGALAAYEVRGERMSVNVTKAGGEISWAKKSIDVEDMKLTYGEALDKARMFLAGSGIADMKESYYIINDNTCTINFSAVQDDIILYPDLIKVTVELNEGGIVEYEAQGYLMNHRERDIAEPALSLEEAAARVSGSLTVTGSSLAIIPTEGKNEVLTYEFHCKNSSGNELLVYINTETGLEEEVYLLDRSDSGIITR